MNRIEYSSLPVLALSVKVCSVFTVSVRLFIPSLPLLAFSHFSVEILDFKAPLRLKEK